MEWFIVELEKYCTEKRADLVFYLGLEINLSQSQHEPNTSADKRPLTFYHCEGHSIGRKISLHNSMTSGVTVFTEGFWKPIIQQAV